MKNKEEGKIKVIKWYSQITCKKCGKKITGQSDISAKNNFQNHKEKCKKKKKNENYKQ